MIGKDLAWAEPERPPWLSGDAAEERPGWRLRAQSARAYLHAFQDPFTYDLVHNGAALFGLVWGVPVPILALVLNSLIPGHEGMTWWALVREHPIHWLFLAHPLLFAFVFGAHGTVRRALESENRRLIQRLTELAITDPLTEVHNRRYVLEALKWCLARYQRNGEGGAVVLFDLDRFKRVNDERGHLAGDRVLRDVALALKSTLRRSDPLGRYGGDEFLLVMVGRQERAIEMVKRAQAAVLQATGMALSAGIAYWPDDGEGSDDLVAVADRRLSESKGGRRLARPLVRRAS